MSGLELDAVVKRYRSGDELVHAVDGVTLTVARGEVLALYGPSGSGKSTLLLLAAGLVAPDAGSVRFDGCALAALPEERLAEYQRREVGFVSQSFDLLPSVPAIDNAAIKLLADRVPLRVARREALPWLERVGLGRRLYQLPGQLSGGERQRVAIARALANGPRLVLADEPTGNLDTQRGREVLALLMRVSREREAAVVLVTHDPRAAEMADRVLTLCDGRLAPYAQEQPARPGAIRLARHG
ncbi:MAG TPA: ABC transporter ATP-binding protein [Conexibacter sp.]